MNAFLEKTLKFLPVREKLILAHQAGGGVTLDETELSTLWEFFELTADFIESAV